MWYKRECVQGRGYPLLGTTQYFGIAVNIFEYGIKNSIGSLNPLQGGAASCSLQLSSLLYISGNCKRRIPYLEEAFMHSD